MKVLHLTTHFNIGGISNYVLSLTRTLKNKGVVSVVGSSGGGLEGELKKNGIEHKRLDIKTKFEFAPKVFGSALKLKRLIRDESIDIVHAHTRVSQVAGFLAARIAGIPYVTTCHGFFKKRLSRMAFDLWGDKVIAISSPVRDSLINDFRVKPNRVELIYTGVDIDKFSKRYSPQEVAGFKQRLGLKEGPIVGAIGRLSPVKGHKVFIEAMREISAGNRKVQGIIIGDGPEEKDLKKLAKSLGIQGSFHFYKSDTDTTKYLAVMDIFVFPSIKEGLGISLLEAMAARRPCVASDIGGISDIIRDGENGMLFEVDNAKMLAASVIRLLADEGLRRRLSMSAADTVKGRFSLDTMAEKVQMLYKNVLGLS